MNQQFSTTPSFASDDRGATIVEYAIVIAVIALVSVLLISALGISVRDFFTTDTLVDAVS